MKKIFILVYFFIIFGCKDSELERNEIINLNKSGNLTSLKQYIKLLEINKSNFNEKESIVLNNNKISNLIGVNRFRNLKSLEISNNKITKIEGIEGLVNLEDLNLSGNHITKIEGLGNLKKLKRLQLAGNPITDYSGLNEIPQLEELNLSNTPIEKLELLNGVTNLKSLIIHNSKIKIIEGCTLEYLQGLDLRYSRVEKFGEMKGMKNLQFLDVSTVPYDGPLDPKESEYWLKLTKVEHLEDLPKLSVFNCYSNNLGPRLITRRSLEHLINRYEVAKSRKITYSLTWNYERLIKVRDGNSDDFKILEE